MPRRSALRIICEVAREFRVPARDLMSRKRTQWISRVRHRAWASLHDEGYIVTEIADLFYRDHTTVLYGLRKARK